MRKKYLAIVLLCLSASLCQTAIAQDNQKRFEIEADPIAFLLSGYSLHAGYMVGHVRFDAGFYGIKQPSFFVGNDKFSVFSSGVGVKADYFLKKNHGLFMGLQSDYVTDKIRLKSTGNFEKADDVTFGLRGGYRFKLGTEKKFDRGFFLSPWVAIIYSADASNVTLDGETYEQSSWSIFPTIHLGYRF